MATLADFEKLAGKSVKVNDIHTDYYVPGEDDEVGVEEALEDLEFEYGIESQLGEDPGEWEVLAIGAYIEEGEILQCDEVLAYHPETGRVLLNDEGTVRLLETSFSELTVEEYS